MALPLLILKTNFTKPTIKGAWALHKCTQHLQEGIYWQYACNIPVVNAHKSTVPSKVYLANKDAFTSDDVQAVAQYMQDNIRSRKRIGDGLKRLFENAKTEADKSVDMFGDVPKISKDQLLKDIAKGDESNVVYKSDDMFTQAESSPVQQSLKRGDKKPTSWAIVNRETGEPVMETWLQSVVDKLNTKKYAAVPIDEYLPALNNDRDGNNERKPVTSNEEMHRNIKKNLLDNNKYSENKTTPKAKSTVTELENTLQKLTGGKKLKNVEVVQSHSDASVQGMYNPITGKVTLVADNIAPNQAEAVLLHEIWHRNENQLLTPQSQKQLREFVTKWQGASKDSLEYKVYEAANRRAKASGDYDGEFVAYAIEEAERRGASISNKLDNTAGGLLTRVRNLVQRAVAKYLPNYKKPLTASDLVAMARNAFVVDQANDGYADERVQTDGDKQYSNSELLAPNGKPSKLTAKQYAQVRTPQFKAWFGDWENDPANASKVVDENGEPMVVYHGTTEKFNQFDKGMIGKRFGYDKKGFFFTSSKRTAISYAMTDEEINDRNFTTRKDSRDIAASRIMGVFVVTKTPITGKVLSEQPRFDQSKSYFEPIDVFDDNRETISVLLDGGKYDGVMFRGDGQRLIVAIEPNQIKSATDNTGEFSLANNDIRYSRTDDTKAAYESRIDALYKGDDAEQQGVKILDRSDMLGFLGYQNKPVFLVESKVKQGIKNHNLTSDDWKKIPKWLDSPAMVFKSDTVAGRFVFVAPDLSVNGDVVHVIVEPNANTEGNKGLKIHLLINAYDSGSKTPIMRWVNDRLLKYIDKNNAPKPLSKLGLQLPNIERKINDAGYIVPTQKQFGKWLSENNGVKADDIRYSKAEAKPEAEIKPETKAEYTARQQVNSMNG